MPKLKLPTEFPIRTTATSYAVDLPAEIAAVLFRYEDHDVVMRDANGGVSLLNDLTKVCAEDIEYDGHYGPAVYYTMRADWDRPYFHARVQALIRRHILLALAAQPKELNA